MIRAKETPADSRLVIDLTGPQGNAFVLLAFAKSFCERLGKNYEEIEAEMKARDYDWLVQTFDHHFGEFVILEV